MTSGRINQITTSETAQANQRNTTALHVAKRFTTLWIQGLRLGSDEPDSCKEHIRMQADICSPSHLILQRCIQRYELPAKFYSNWSRYFGQAFPFEQHIGGRAEAATNTYLYLLLIAPLIFNFSLIIMQPTFFYHLRRIAKLAIQ